MHPTCRLFFVRMAPLRVVAGCLAALGLSLAVAAQPAGGRGAAHARPNILMIISDDHGIDDLGCYGNPVIKTPNLDALAAAGTRFTHAYCTTASCSASRSVILSGLHNHRNGHYGHEHSIHHFSSFDNIKSLPVLLAEAGYRTARVGKFHIAPQSVYAFQTVLSAGAANDPASLGRSPVEMADQTRDFLAARDARPFFLMYATDDPHRANIVLPDGRPSFDTYPEPNSFGNRREGYAGINPVVYRPEDVIVPPFLPDTTACRAELAEYYQSVSRLDQGIGRLIQILKETGQYERTVILYLSDNGVAFAGAKTTVYDPGIRLPFIVRMPGHRHPGSVQPAMVSWVDLTPTLLDVAGAARPGMEFHGRSFRAGLDGTPLSGWDEIYASHTFHEVTMYYPMRAVRNRRYKLIHNIASGLTYPSALDLIKSPTWISVVASGGTVYGRRPVEQYLQRPPFELYDLAEDPHEVVNLAGDPAHRGVMQELLARLKAFQERTHDPWRHKWDYE
jgi:N-sulfoglucosamine sulfohydrolase